jgi:hypothetical protein
MHDKVSLRQGHTVHASIKDILLMLCRAMRDMQLCVIAGCSNATAHALLASG